VNSRRQFVAQLAASALAAPLSLVAQPSSGRIRRLGIFQPSSPPEALEQAIHDGLKGIGYVEGRDFIVEARWAQGRLDLLDSLAQQLVAAKVDLITTLSTPLALAASRATSTIPIVFTGVGDPVGTGLVRSLAHPGGNATGLATLNSELSGKRLEMLREIVPHMSHFALVWNDTNPSMMLSAHRVEEIGAGMGLGIQALGIHDLMDFDGAFAAIQGGSASALLLLADPFTRANRQRIIDFAARARLPVIYEAREFVESGGLVSYGPSLPAMQRRSAIYIDKIFRGAHPGDLPVEQPTEFELFVNLKTARALGIDMPASILERADKLIE
jgi:putative tryptophan/tyrosine transport system substrate-binding protein